MAKRRSIGSISKRKDGRYQVSFTHGYDEKGRPKRSTKYFKSKKEAYVYYSKMVTEISQGNNIKPESITMEKWNSVWLFDRKKGQIKAKSFSNYEQHIRLYINPNIGHIKVQKLTERDVREKLIAKLKSEGKSESTINNSLRTLKTILNQAMSERLIYENVCKNIRIKKNKSQKEQKIFSKDEQETFVKALKGNKYENAIIVLLNTGLRIAELSGLRWVDVDFKDGYIYVRQTAQRIRIFEEGEFIGSEMVIDTPKTDKSIRCIPMLEATRDALIKQRELQSIDKKIGYDKYIDNDLCFPTSIGTPTDHKNLWYEMKNILKCNNLPDLSLHNLRHNFASRLIENGIGLKIVSELLGHSSVQTTGDVYAHVQKSTLKEQMQSVEGIFAG